MHTTSRIFPEFLADTPLNKDALGWDIQDPTRVRLEHRANPNKVDYVLVSSSGGFLAVVEAKPADAGLKEADRRQASGYATEIGARYALLTNGGRWEAWEMVPQKPRRESIVVEVHLTTGEVADIASNVEEAAAGCSGRLVVRHVIIFR